MADTSHRARRTAGAVLLGIACGTLGGLAACSNAPKAYTGGSPPAAGVLQVSPNGASAFGQARNAWATTLASGAWGRDLARGLSQAVALLDTAIVNDPYNPLFRAKRADLLLALGEVEAAEQGYQYALDTVGGVWPPGWIGLASVSYERLLDAPPAQRELLRASVEDYLLSAEHALLDLEDYGRSGPDTEIPLTIPLLNIPISQPDDEESVPLGDPTLPKSVRYGLMLEWLNADMGWTPENTNLLGGDQSNLDIGINRGVDAFRNLHARIEYLRALLAVERGLDTRTVLQKFDSVNDWDAGYFPASLSRARVLSGAGRYAEAEKLLAPTVYGGSLVRHRPDVIHQLFQIYADWYSQTGDIEAGDEAQKLFDMFKTQQPGYPPPYLTWIELNLNAARLQSSRANLNNAVSTLDFARQQIAPAAGPDFQRELDRFDAEARSLARELP